MLGGSAVTPVYRAMLMMSDNGIGDDEYRDAYNDNAEYSGHELGDSNYGCELGAADVEHGDAADREDDDDS